MFIFVFSHLALDSIKERHSVPDKYRYPLEDTVFPRPKSVAHVTKVRTSNNIKPIQWNPALWPPR